MWRFTTVASLLANLLFALVVIQLQWGDTIDKKFSEWFAREDTASKWEVITEGDISKYNLPGVKKIGDWYTFTEDSVEIRLEISKLEVAPYGLETFGSTAYYSRAEIIYPDTWIIGSITIFNFMGAASMVGATQRGKQAGYSFLPSSFLPRIQTTARWPSRLYHWRIEPADRDDIRVTWLPKSNDWRGKYFKKEAHK